MNGKRPSRKSAFASPSRSIPTTQPRITGTGYSCLSLAVIRKPSHSCSTLRSLILFLSPLPPISAKPTAMRLRVTSDVRPAAHSFSSFSSAVAEVAGQLE